jgi:hypothetical protein
MLDYYLTENLLTPSQDDYMAHVTNVRYYTIDEIIDLILKSGAGLTHSDVLSVWQAQKDTISSIVAAGDGIDTELMIIHPSVQGVFHGANDSYDPVRHHIRTNLQRGTVLRDAAAKIKTRKVQVTDPIPTLQQVVDMVNNTVNDTLSRDSVMEIIGSRLKLLLEDSGNGIFMIPVDDPNDERQLPNVIENKPARLMAMIPNDLQPREYYLEVRTTCSSNANRPSKTLKRGRFRKILTIV